MALVVVCIIATASFINIFATQGVKLNRKNKTINVGQTFNLKVRGKKVKKIVYKSSNNKVASVSKKGKVKANAEEIATKEIETNEITTRETVGETISVETQPEMKHENRETTGDFVLPELSIK